MHHPYSHMPPQKVSMGIQTIESLDHRVIFRQREDRADDRYRYINSPQVAREIKEVVQGLIGDDDEITVIITTTATLLVWDHWKDPFHADLVLSLIHI